MKGDFVKTKNVKKFITMINNLINRSVGVPGMALVYGEPGLGKTHTILWWAANNDAILVSAKQTMTARWLLEEIVKECGETPMYRTSDLFNQIVKNFIREPKVLIVDEVDYLADDKSSVEILRDIHDRLHCPIILVGMSKADKKLKRYEHLYDRFSEVLHFESFSKEDVNLLIDVLSEIKFTPDAIDYIHRMGNRSRQIVKLIDKAETLAKTNNLSEIDIHWITKIIKKEDK